MRTKNRLYILLLTTLTLSFTTDTFGQTKIESEVSSYYPQIKEVIKTNNSYAVDSTSDPKDIIMGANTLWTSHENKIKTELQLKNLNFKGLTFVNIQKDKKYLVASWVDCDNLIVLEIKKRHKKLYCKLIKQTIGNVKRPELINCK